MKVVIDIPNYDYEYIKNNCIVPIKYDNHIYDAIRNGTPIDECKAEDCISRFGAEQVIRKAYDRLMAEIDDLPNVYPKAEDCISRTEAIEMFVNTEDADSCKWTTAGIVAELKDLPSVYPKSDKSVLDDIKAEISTLKRFELRGEITPLVNVDNAIKIIDNYINRKEQTDEV